MSARQRVIFILVDGILFGINVGILAFRGQSIFAVIAIIFAAISLVALFQTIPARALFCRTQKIGIR